MRRLNNRDDISVHAVSGIHTVLFNMDAKEGKEKGLLGFAVKRIDQTEDESTWLRGVRTFEINADSHHPGALVSTWKNPIQDFHWGDYTVKPGRKYTYIVVPVRGKPGNLRHDKGIKVTVSTEEEDRGEHAVFFNRAVAGSQAYARKFGNLPPDEVGPPALKWLSRGLVEGMVEFIGQAKGKGWSLYASVYEFNYIPVLEEFKKAIDRGVDVKIVFDNKDTKSGPAKANREAMNKVGIDSRHAVKRSANPSYISHNKFILLLEKGKPRQVWTGSTNITEGGIFGHSNVGHIIRNEKIAAAYHSYWRELSGDPDAKTLRPFNDRHTPLPGENVPRHYIHPVFSPRGSLEALEWYAERMESARSSVFLTAAFGISKEFQSILEEDKPYLRYVLLDKPGKGLDLISRHHHNVISIGGVLNDNVLDDWLDQKWRAERLTGLNTHVQYIHTKYMLIDPLGDDPMVITGSANFSKNSTINNDENMVIIRGNKRVADMYLGEFMRLFDHFRFRGTKIGAKAKDRKGAQPSLYLTPDDTWTREFFQKGHVKEMQKRLFRGY